MLLGLAISYHALLSSCFAQLFQPCSRCNLSKQSLGEAVTGLAEFKVALQNAAMSFTNAPPAHIMLAAETNRLGYD